MAQNHSESSKIFLNSVNRAMMSSSASSAPSSMMSGYFLSREWQQLFPSLLESLDRFDSLSTSSPLFSTPQCEAGTRDLDHQTTPVCSISSYSTSSSVSFPIPSPHFETPQHEAGTRDLDQQALSVSSISDSGSTMALELSDISIASRILAAQAITASTNEIDITPYLCMPQIKASRLLRIRSSKLSAQWRIASNNRKWPFRKVKRLDCDISTLVKNLEVNPLSLPLIEKLQKLLNDREALLAPVKIAILDRNFNGRSATILVKSRE